MLGPASLAAVAAAAAGGEDLWPDLGDAELGGEVDASADVLDGLEYFGLVPTPPDAAAGGRLPSPLAAICRPLVPPGGLAPPSGEPCSSGGSAPDPSGGHPLDAPATAATEPAADEDGFFDDEEDEDDMDELPFLDMDALRRLEADAGPSGSWPLGQPHDPSLLLAALLPLAGGSSGTPPQSADGMLPAPSSTLSPTEASAETGSVPDASASRRQRNRAAAQLSRQRRRAAAAEAAARHRQLETTLARAAAESRALRRHLSAYAQTFGPLPPAVMELAGPIPAPTFPAVLAASSSGAAAAGSTGTTAEAGSVPRPGFIASATPLLPQPAAVRLPSQLSDRVTAHMATPAASPAPLAVAARRKRARPSAASPMGLVALMSVFAVLAMVWPFAMGPSRVGMRTTGPSLAPAVIGAAPLAGRRSLLSLLAPAARVPLALQGPATEALAPVALEALLAGTGGGIDNDLHFLNATLAQGVLTRLQRLSRQPLPPLPALAGDAFARQLAQLGGPWTADPAELQLGLGGLLGPTMCREIFSFDASVASGPQQQPPSSGRTIRREDLQAEAEEGEEGVAAAIAAGMATSPLGRPRALAGGNRSPRVVAEGEEGPHATTADAGAGPFTDGAGGSADGGPFSGGNVGGGMEPGAVVSLLLPSTPARLGPDGSSKTGMLSQILVVLLTARSARYVTYSCQLPRQLHWQAGGAVVN